MQTELDDVITRGAPGRPTADQLCSVCVDYLGVDEAAISVVIDGTSHGTWGSSSALSRRLDEHQFTFEPRPVPGCQPRR